MPLQALLTCGEIDDTFRETLYPEVAVTSKRKTQPFGPFWDAYHVAYSELAGVAVPATYIAAALDQKFLVNGFEERRAGGPLTLTDELLSSLEAMYARFSGADKGSPIADAKLDRQGIDAWLTAINGEVGRGSEYRSATDLMENNSDHLTFGDFKEIYARELREGKYWGVQHDLNACGVDFSSAADQAKPFEAAFDGIHVNIGAWAVAAVVEPLPRDRKDEVYSLRAYPPNAWHPSDHLPVAAVLRRVPP